MAFPKKSTAHEDAVSSVAESIQYEDGIQPTRAHDPYGTDVGGVLES